MYAQKLSKELILIVSLMLGCIMATINVTAFTIMLPIYMEKFQTDLLTVQWLSTGYTVAQCMSVLAVGYLADKYSAQNVYICGIGLMALFSFSSCFIPNIYALIVLRLCAGAAAGFVSCAGAAIVYQTFSENHQLQVMSYLTMAAGLGVAFGPAVGGLLEGFLGWRCVYIFNATIGALIILPLCKYVPKRVVESCGKLNYLNFIGGALGTFLILYVLSYGGAWGWFSPKTIGGLVLSLALLSRFIIVEAKSERPLLNVRILKNKYFRNGAIMYGLGAIALVLSPYVMSFFFQRVWGYSALKAGEAIVFPSLAMAVVSPLAAKAGAKVPTRPIIVGFYLTLVGITYMLGQLSAEISLFYVMLWLMLRYVVIGATEPLIANCAYSMVEQELMSHASALVNWIRHMCNALALAVFTGILDKKMTGYLEGGCDSAEAMCLALNDLTIYSMFIIMLCVPIACALKDKAAIKRQAAKRVKK